MNFWLTVIRQVGRNLRQTWASQLMTLLTVTLSVLIFAFFYLVYANMLTIGDKLGDDLRLIVYLEEEPGPEMQEQLRRKITTFDEVEEIHFISRAEAYERFAKQLGQNQDVLEDMPHDFLPASIEVVPLKTLRSLNQIKLFSDIWPSCPGPSRCSTARSGSNASIISPGCSPSSSCSQRQSADPHHRVHGRLYNPADHHGQTGGTGTPETRRGNE